MVFWILLGIAALVVIAMLGMGDVGDWVAGVATAGLLFGFVTGALAVTVAQVGERTVGEVEHYNLSALATRTHQPGAYFFLGSGVSEEEQVYRYLEVSADGGNRMKQAGIEESVVYEVAGQPRLEVRELWAEAGWLLPFSVGTGKEFAFFIPEGSIIAGYEVAP